MGQRGRPGSAFRSDTRRCSFDPASVDAVRAEIRRAKPVPSEAACARLIADLESAVSDYWLLQDIGAEDRPSQADALERVAAAARGFEQARQAFAEALASLDGRGSAELADSDLGAQCVREAGGRVQAAIRRHPALRTIELAAQEATRRLRTGGRPSNVRWRMLAVSVARALSQAGVRPTTYSLGTPAAILRIVLTVADGTDPPDNLTPLLKHAMASVSRPQSRTRARRSG
jgi:hypothetical protein